MMLFFFNDTATTEIYTYLHTPSLHDALPISFIEENDEKGALHLHPDDIELLEGESIGVKLVPDGAMQRGCVRLETADGRSEEHTSELQSLMRNSYAVFCLKKKKIKKAHIRYRDILTSHYVHDTTTQSY